MASRRGKSLSQSPPECGAGLGWIWVGTGVGGLEMGAPALAVLELCWLKPVKEAPAIAGIEQAIDVVRLSPASARLTVWGMEFSRTQTS